MTTTYELGRILWAEVADSNGIRKQRPVMVIGSTGNRLPTDPIDVVAITSRIQQPMPADFILLPWHPTGHPRTGLKRKCAVVCSWLTQITATDVEDVAGLVSGSLLSEILGKIAEKQSAEPPKTPESSETTTADSDTKDSNS